MKKEMPTIKIEKNILYPEGYSNNKLPFVEMEIGDSFLIPPNLQTKISAAMWWYGKRNKMKFSKRGDRVWRIK